MDELTGLLDENLRLRRLVEDCRAHLGTSRGGAVIDTQQSGPSRDLLERVFASHVRTTLLPMAVISPKDRTVLAVNARFCDLIGNAEQALVGRSVENLFAWTEPAAAATFAHYVFSDSSTHFEASFRGPRGEVKPVLVSSSRITDRSASAIGLVVVNSWGRKESEQLRRQFEQFFRLSGDMLCIGRGDGYLARVNDAVLALGYTRDELFSRPVIDFIHPADVDGARRAVAGLVAGGPSARYECRYRRKDETYRWLRLTTWMDESGTLASSARDVTSEKVEARAIRRLTKELSRSNRELDELATVAAHDLQEPLRKIQMFGDRLREHVGSSLDQEGTELLVRVQSAAKRGQSLIEGLLAYARVSSVHRSTADVNLNVIGRHVISDLESQLAKVSGQVHLGGLPTISADALQMRQLFQNLISNGLKFHRSEVAPVVHVTAVQCTGPSTSVAQSLQPREWWKIVVSDNGIGFDEKYSSQLFRLFRRLNGRSQFEGSGIGLAICKRIVESHGGTIVAQVNMGGGADFIVTLPQRAEREVDDDEPGSP